VSEATLKAIRDFRVRDYVNDYEFRGDSDYAPNEHEKALIEDALLGAIALIEEQIKSVMTPKYKASGI
jgi:hypothetical protein